MLLLHWPLGPTQASSVLKALERHSAAAPRRGWFQGYGAGMKPCCLETQRMVTLQSCRVAHRLGGATAFQLNRCPRHAAQALPACHKHFVS